jgi:hypothetical protein
MGSDLTSDADMAHFNTRAQKRRTLGIAPNFWRKGQK